MLFAEVVADAAVRVVCAMTVAKLPGFAPTTVIPPPANPHPATSEQASTATEAARMIRTEFFRPRAARDGFHFCECVRGVRMMSVPSPYTLHAQGETDGASDWLNRRFECGG